MSKYRLCFCKTVVESFDVEADSLSEAKKKAQDGSLRGPVSIETNQYDLVSVELLPEITIDAKPKKGKGK